MSHLVSSQVKTVKNNQGFTLIELIVYTVLISLLAGAFISFSIDLTTTSQKSRTKIEVQQSARFALERILFEIRSAEGVNTGASTFNSHPGVLSLDVVALADDPTIFSLNAGVLEIKQGAAAAEPLTPDDLEVSNLVFSNRGTGRTKNIKVELTVRHPNTANSLIFNAEVPIRGAASIRKGSNP